MSRLLLKLKNCRLRFPRRPITADGQKSVALSGLSPLLTEKFDDEHQYGDDKGGYHGLSTDFLGRSRAPWLDESEVIANWLPRRILRRPTTFKQW